MAYVPSSEAIGASLVGAVAFPTVLAGAQVVVFKPLTLTYSLTSRVSSVAGGLAVLTAGFTASLLTAKSFTILKSSFSKSEYTSLQLTVKDILVSSLSSVIIFRALGGRFSAVLPSHLLQPGAFAVEWLPASRGSRYASNKERELIQTIGQKYGCHSCGKKKVNFVADHQPPNKIIEGKVLSQQFYPQCKSCSQQQGSVLANGPVNTRAVRTHPFSLRPYHTFLPLPLIFSYLFGGTKESREDSKSTRIQVPSEVAVQTEGISTKRTLRNLIHDSDINELVTNFPLLIIWQKMVGFLDSFGSPGDSFHMTLWSFIIIAAWGTL